MVGIVDGDVFVDCGFVYCYEEVEYEYCGCEVDEIYFCMEGYGFVGGMDDIVGWWIG